VMLTKKENTGATIVKTMKEMIEDGKKVLD
jgi:hypothetical protein